MSNLIARNITSSSIVVSGYRVSSIDSTNVEVVIVENTSSHDRRNAFKYTENGTSYWYVVGINHIGWVSDLSTVGYEEVPSVVLPTVSIDANPVGGSTRTLTVNDFTGPLHYMGSGGWSGDAISYDRSKKYSLTTYNDGTTSGLQACGIFTPIMSSTQPGGPYYVGVENISASSQSFMSVFVATCSDSSATVVTVYSRFNTAYNAFKYTANGTDYYYVLDEIQTDWTDDLSSIGYSLSIEVWFYLDRASASKTFEANDYWGTFIIDDTDRQTLANYGVTIYHTTYAENQYQVDKTSIDNFSFEPLGLYSGVRTGDLGADMSNFYCGTYTGGIYRSVVIKSINAYSVSAKTWKCRITKL